MKAKTKIAVLFVCIATALVQSGCKSPRKMRDIELKGMYVNGYSEVLAIGAGRLTSIPGEREALAAHYEEDTAWLSPSTKTHKLDIFLVGTNSVGSSKEVIESVCRAFSEVAPVVSSNNAAVAKGGVTAFDLLKANAGTRQAVETAKLAAQKASAEATAAVAKAAASEKAAPPEEGCADCVEGAADCPECEDR